MKYSITLLILLSVVSTENAATFAARAAWQSFSKSALGKTLQGASALFAGDAILGGLYGPKITNAQNLPQTALPTAPANIPAPTVPTPTPPALPAADVTPPTPPAPAAPAPQAPTPTAAPKSNPGVFKNLGSALATGLYKTANGIYDGTSFVVKKIGEGISYVYTNITAGDLAGSALTGVGCYYLAEENERSVVKHGIVPTAATMALCMLGKENTQAQIILGAIGTLCGVLGYAYANGESTRKTFTKKPLTTTGIALSGAVVGTVAANVTPFTGVLSAALLGGAYYVAKGISATAVGTGIKDKMQSLWNSGKTKASDAWIGTGNFVSDNKVACALSAALAVSVGLMYLGRSGEAVEAVTKVAATAVKATVKA